MEGHFEKDCSEHCLTSSQASSSTSTTFEGSNASHVRLLTGIDLRHKQVKLLNSVWAYQAAKQLTYTLPEANTTVV